MVSVVRGSVLILLVALVAAVLAWRNRPWRTDLLSVVGTVGAFVPLVVLALVAELTGTNGTAPGGGEVAPLSTQNAVVAASFCTLAWLVSRSAHWPVAVAAWTAAAAGVLGIGGARLYLGLDTASGTAAAVLLGVLWTVVFMVAWATRDRAVGNGSAPCGPGTPAAVAGATPPGRTLLGCADNHDGGGNGMVRRTPIGWAPRCSAGLLLASALVGCAAEGDEPIPGPGRAGRRHRRADRCPVRRGRRGAEPVGERCGIDGFRAES